jgi:hypothetical protein
MDRPLFAQKKGLHFRWIDVIFSFVDNTIGTRIHSGTECGQRANSLEK